MTIMLLDFQNFCHRTRAGFTNEGSAFLFKFIRNLRALVAELKPTSLVLVGEGSPTHRYEAYPDYKGHRRLKDDDKAFQEKYAELAEFKKAANGARDFCLKSLEVSFVSHAALEADDLIAGLALKLSGEGKQVVVASNDQDFRQLLGHGSPRIHVYDTGKKEYMTPVTGPDGRPLTAEQHVTLKALLGDKSDNVPPVPGFGPKKALKAAAAGDLGLVGETQEAFERNVKLVRFLEVTPEMYRRVTLDRGRFDPAALLIDLQMFEMHSLLEPKAYDRLVETFGSLGVVRL